MDVRAIFGMCSVYSLALSVSFPTKGLQGLDRAISGSRGRSCCRAFTVFVHCWQDCMCVEHRFVLLFFFSPYKIVGSAC